MLVREGQIVGRVVDPTGMAISGVTVTVEGSARRQSAVTDTTGAFVVSDVPSGPIQVTSQMAGFATARRALVYDQRPRQVDFTMKLGALTETVTVEAEAPAIATGSAFANVDRDEALRLSQSEVRRPQQQAQEVANAPSANVQSLQRRAAGVLPVKMEVPRAGTSHRFVKPLVIDEPVAVRFRYRRR
jgi:hypothetical protein